MGCWQPVTNIKNFVFHNPPMVTFFFSLLSLAISFICLASYSYTHSLPNPDIDVDWNHVLSSLSQLELCIKPRANSTELVSPATTHPNWKQNKRESVSTSTNNSSSVTHLHVQVPLRVSLSTANGPVQNHSLFTTLRAGQLHLKGDQSVNVTLQFTSGVTYQTCIAISVPTQLLPQSPLPPKCPAFNSSPIQVEVNNELPSTFQTCYSLHYTNDPTLAVMLTQVEQNMAVHHLLEVSVSLLALCLMLCLAASVSQLLICCNPWNGLHLQNVCN
ncbi:transmembrane protein 248 [Cynoglossus semilaevis]|uniref:transmembrane protein 248 n=1 Tax=Cynoglossus semilaevis TaxID=244447 RepID=UPI000D63161B|nr:transmembrane protein 248-like [Cynoglossus semilaevis]